jgi:hypothetical protein
MENFHAAVFTLPIENNKFIHLDIVLTDNWVFLVDKLQNVSQMDKDEFKNFCKKISDIKNKECLLLRSRFTSFLTINDKMQKRVALVPGAMATASKMYELFKREVPKYVSAKPQTNVEHLKNIEIHFSTIVELMETFIYNLADELSKTEINFNPNTFLNAVIGQVKVPVCESCKEFHNETTPDVTH